MSHIMVICGVAMFGVKEVGLNVEVMDPQATVTNIHRVSLDMLSPYFLSPLGMLTDT